jgi:hypothetical protein
MGLVPGVLALNLVFCGVGYCLLGGPLRGLRPQQVLSYCGIALLVGTGAIGVVLDAVAVAGGRADVVAFTVVALGLAALGVGTAVWLPHAWWERGASPPPSAAPEATRQSVVAATVFAGALVAVVILALVAAFRASPFLDDTWTLWLPRGLTLDALGLDERVFAPNSYYVPFPHPDYPLVWSLVLNLGQRFVGATDVRAANGQLAILLVAFLGAAARLLWGWARPWMIWLGLLVLAGAPEFLRQMQSGGADLPLAAYLSLFLISSSIWLASGQRLMLALGCLFAAVSLLTKSEGAPQLLIFALLLTVFGWSAGTRRLASLWAAVAAAFVAAAPWLLWRQAHGIRGLSDIGLAEAFSPHYLFARTERVGPAAETLGRHLVNPREWLVIVPLAIALSLVAAIRRRRAFWLGPCLLLGAGYGFWIWVNWTDPSDLEYRLSTSSYRVIDTLVLTAGVLLPLLAEGAWVRRGKTAGA